jgi:GH15 family glucan-1,4-alpha-glucosidase
MSENRLDIADHGLIGDLRTCALVGTDGTIDWFCAPRFDSPSVFGAILDGERGGCWRVQPTCEVTRTQQFYLPDTAVLITRFLTPNGVAEVHDFMPVMIKADVNHRQRLVRRVSGVRGKIDLQMRLDARPDYARQSCSAKPLGDGVLITGDGIRMGLLASAALTVDDEGADNPVVCTDVQLTRGDTAFFVLEMLDGDDEPSADTVDMTDALLDGTTSY